jgi:hypothetical protein
MKILYVPFHEGGVSHQIPLLALQRLVSDPSIQVTFLLPRIFHEFFRKNGLDYFDLDYDGSVHTEVEAYRKYRPDVVVDDWSLSTGFATSLTGVPRVTIQRISTFPGHVPYNKNHPHNIAIDFSRYPDVTRLGLPQPQTLSDLFERADMKIIPGIKSVEVLPEALRDDPTYVYCGPLLGDDYFVKDEIKGRAETTLDRFKSFDALQDFFDRHRSRKIVYFTFGSVAKATGRIHDCLRYMLDSDRAVVTNIKVEDLTAGRQGLYFRAKFLPMHFVCSNVDLMIHPCSTGAYHYPILHNVPSITIGTKHYDQEDAAIRLQELGASVHIPAPDECDDFVETFKATVEKYFDESTSFVESQKKVLASLNSEVRETASKFVYEDVLSRAIQESKRRKK